MYKENLDPLSSLKELRLLFIHRPEYVMANRVKDNIYSIFFLLLTHPLNRPKTTIN